MEQQAHSADADQNLSHFEIALENREDCNSPMGREKRMRTMLSPAKGISGEAENKQPQILRLHHASRGSAQDDSRTLFGGTQ
jgi:hypothetical protein